MKREPPFRLFLMLPQRDLAILMPQSHTLQYIVTTYLRCMRTIDAYAAGVKDRIEGFKERFYKGHRQVVDKSKWEFFLIFF